MKFTSLLAILSVLVLGLPSCGPDKKQQESSSVELSNWQLKMPNIITKQHSISLKDFSMRPDNSLSVADQIEFQQEGDGQRPTKLEIQSQCLTFPSEKSFKQTFHLTLRKTLSLLSFLPEDLLKLGSKEGAHCDFSFVAKSADGSTHKFFIRAIKISEIFDGQTARIFAGTQELGKKSNEQIHLNESNIEKLNIRTERKITGTTLLICEQFTSELKVENDDYFEVSRLLSNAEKSKSWIADPLHQFPNQMCRLFFRDSEVTVGMTRFFTFHFNPAVPNVPDIGASIINSQVVGSRITIANPFPYPIHLRINSANISSSVIYYKPYSGTAPEKYPRKVNSKIQVFGGRKAEENVWSLASGEALEVWWDLSARAMCIFDRFSGSAALIVNDQQPEISVLTAIPGGWQTIWKKPLLPTSISLSSQSANIEGAKLTYCQ